MKPEQGGALLALVPEEGRISFWARRAKRAGDQHDSGNHCPEPRENWGTKVWDSGTGPGL